MTNSIRHKLVQDENEWKQALTALPAAHVLQSWPWGQFKSRWGWHVERLLWLRANRPIAAAQILARRIPSTPWYFLYVSKGPALDYSNRELVAQVLADLETYARQHRALFIKIDPDVPRQYGEPTPGAAVDPVGQTVLALLHQRRWGFSPEQIQFRNTVIVDIAHNPDDLLARMKSKWRYNIRLAKRKGVEVRSAAGQDLPAFYHMYAETATRDGFLIRPEAYYLDVWQSFLQEDQADLLLASVEGEVVAGLMLFYFGRQAWYMYGASTGRQRKLMPNHLLQWEAICRAKDRGCTLYDMWGAPDVFAESDGMWGVYRFKRGFGGQVRQGIGAFDFPVKPRLYWAFTQAMPKARALLRKLAAR